METHRCKFAIHVWDDRHPSSEANTNEPLVSVIKRELNRIFFYENTDYDRKTVGILARKIKVACRVL